MSGLGVHMLMGETLKELLWRVHEGEHPEVVYMEMYANADHIGLADLLTEEDE